MKPDRIQSAVDRLLARDQSYQPVALLKLIGRVDAADLSRWESGEFKCLEDVLYGNPEACLEELRLAAAWAGKLGLQAQVEPADGSGRRVFRSSTAEQLARSTWRRAAPSAQGDLFFDTGFAQARSALNQALLAADRSQAEQALADMSRADPGNDVQADSERLIEALAWLEGGLDDPAARLALLEEDVGPRARRLLGAVDGQRFLARFWRQLAEGLNAAEFDPAQALLHPSAVLARVEDWQGVISAVTAFRNYLDQPELLARLANAALAEGDREQGIAAVCQLCWRHGKAAEAWLDACQDDELVRRIEIFWDLDPPLEIALFPAWLVSVAYALPDIPADVCPDTPAAKAWTRFRALRADPTDMDQREWLQREQPTLFGHWLATGR